MSETQTTDRIELPTGENSGSMIRLLESNIGRWVTAEFFVGSNSLISKSGILMAVSENYLVLYDDATGTEIACDFYSLRFVTFYPLSERPGAASQAQESQTEGTTTDAQGIRQNVSAPVCTPTQAAFNYARRKSRRLE